MNIEDLIKPLVKEIKDVLTISVKREVYPTKIVGNRLAAKLLGITKNALNQRIHRGFYIEGYHFKKKSARIYEWDRDALLNEE